MLPTSRSGVGDASRKELQVSVLTPLLDSFLTSSQIHELDCEAKSCPKHLVKLALDALHTVELSNAASYPRLSTRCRVSLGSGCQAQHSPKKKKDDLETRDGSVEQFPGGPS